MSNIVAIVGRPNVGKSTFFNRLTGKKEAIVDPTSGVTRDRHYGKSDWNGVEFSVIDTGGYVDNSGDIFEGEIKKQVRLAIEESDAIIFMVDGKEGRTSMDDDLADQLRRSVKQVFLVVNKIDNYKQLDDIHEFYSLGFDKLYGVSSMNGSGSGELLDDVVKVLPEQKNEDEYEPQDELPRIAVIGRPNAGKSSLINVLLGNDRAIVTPIAGTTRDSVDAHYKYFDLEFLLVDTAGIRKKAKVSENIEFYSVMRAIRSIETSDVCILMVDAERGFEAQDLNIFSLVEKNHKGVVILVNKWDLIEKETNTHKLFEESIREQIVPFQDVPIIFTSVVEKQRIYKAVESAVEVYKNRSKKISTSQLNDFFLPLIQETPPPAWKGKYIKIKYVTQLPMRYPAFVFFCNLPQYVRDPYKRFLENKLREKFNFTGVPFEIYFRQK
ncbi:MAG TPA: ribosome biogenesis GTPase Der [Bacteroidales bacterium]|nr:ribosome biogenesis GTPase Der [Bacteroidales bacterium]